MIQIKKRLLRTDSIFPATPIRIECSVAFIPIIYIFLKPTHALHSDFGRRFGRFTFGFDLG
jgi:hypothetical protein